MNCKPEQLCWIKVPKHKAHRGVEQLHNRVVKTRALAATRPEPIWLVEPPQAIVVTGYITDAQGNVASSGQTFELTGIADSWLVPLQGDPRLAELCELAGLPILEQTA